MRMFLREPLTRNSDTPPSAKNPASEWDKRGLGPGVVAAFIRGSHGSPEQTPLPTLKAQLRALYKRIHPDTFHDYPKAREANEHSFKALQVISLPTMPPKRGRGSKGTSLKQLSAILMHMNRCPTTKILSSVHANLLLVRAPRYQHD
jgi:Domain of unknown function (DUF4460)